MSQRSVVPKHAVYAPRPPLERPASRSHARPTSAPEPKLAEQGRATPVIRPRTRKDAGLTVRVRATHPALRKPATARRRLSVALDALWPAAILMCALGLAFVGLVLGLSALLRQTLHTDAERAAFPLLAGGLTLVLLRGQVSVERYWGLRRRLKLAGDRWTDHALALCYMLAAFFAVAIVATLLACGAALLIGDLF